MKLFGPIIFLFFSINAAAQQDSFALKGKALKIFLDKNHYQPIKWNDSISSRLFNRWLQLLDDNKILFTQAEVDELAKDKLLLDDEINGGKPWTFYKKSILLLKKALARSDSFQNILIAKPLDFSKPSGLHYPFLGYANSVADVLLRHQQLLKWRVLRTLTSQLEEKDQLKNYLSARPADFNTKEAAIRQQILKRTASQKNELSVSDDAFVKKYRDYYLQAMAWCYDPHTTYMNLADKKDFTTSLSGFEYSTGMSLEQNEDGKYEVESLEPGGSAWRSGELHKGDKIEKIKKGSEEEVLDDLDEDEVAELLQGSDDQAIEVTVSTAAGTSKTIKLSKEKVTDDEGIVKSYVINAKQKLGYIQLPGFYTREQENAKTEDDLNYDGCASDVSKEILKLKKENIEGLILDLRYNGGGSMWEAMQLAGIFIDYGPVASVKYKDGKVSFLKDPNRGTIYDGPLLVLVNGSSASASELTSAVLQDYNRALIVGSTTYGKGTAQSILPLDTNYSADRKVDYDKCKDFVKVSEEKFYRVKGNTTQWQGVIPDISLPVVYEDPGYKERNIPSALLPDESKKAMYTALPPLPVEMLKNKSIQRIKADTLFNKITGANEWMEQVTRGRDIPLQWNTYVAFYKKNIGMINTLASVEDNKVKMLNVSNNDFDKAKINFASASGQKINDAYLARIAADIYINEAVNILQDWINK